MQQNLQVWEEFKVDLNGKLTGEMRNNYIKILEGEFENQSTLYHSQINEMKEQLIEKHKKKVNFEKLCDDIADAEAKLNNAKEKLNRTGLCTDGTLASSYHSTGVARENAQRVQKEIDKLTASIKAPTTFKNKIISLMLGSTKIGQAQKIMFQVLGNGVLSDVDMKCIEFNK
jgi:hypothetical protein